MYISNIIKQRIPEWKKDVLERDKDKVIVIDGREGSGKSVLAQQLASALDPNFNIDKIAFNSIQFISKIKSPKRKKGDCIILDEAFSAANSRASMSSVNRAMIGIATEMRQLNLFVIIVLPSFFDLDKYFAIWRCDVLLHVYFNKEGKRGNYIIFPFHKKKRLYLNGKKLYDYNCVKSPYPPCAFTKGYVVDEMEYRKRKAEAFRVRAVSGREEMWKERTIKLILFLKKNYGLIDKEIAEITGSTMDAMRKLRQEYVKKKAQEKEIMEASKGELD